ncbi:MAG TPA: CPBP family intramembrane glutamic endopeptidase [Vicinamibacterales bacterium]|nr:CPBP family intramembrane glutamic endopeptidase [Vicinamibacterales bacterium]
MFPQAFDVGLPGWYHVFTFGVLIPFAVVRNYRRMAGKSMPLPDRMRHFRTTTVMLSLFTGLSVLVARAEWIDLFRFDASRLPQGLLAGVVMFAAAIAFMRPRWRRAVEQRRRVVYLFMPDNATERVWWIVVSTLAGIGEEITWRGAQTALLASLTGSFVLGAILCAIQFGIAHYMQGWKSAAIITVFALAFQGVVWVSGSLYVAMLVHVLYDITAGLTYGRLGRELGYTPADVLSAS